MITRADFRDMYWTFAQMAAHHMSNGCNLQAGDLLGSGTVSGPTDESRACLAELTARGHRSAGAARRRDPGLAAGRGRGDLPRPGRA